MALKIPPLPTNHSSFLTDPQAYQECEQFWIRLWESLSARSWAQPWMHNGLKDGNPIFSAISLPQRKGLRVIQHLGSPESPEFFFWMDLAGDEIQVQELVVSLVLSEGTVAQALDLIRGWAAEST